MFCPKCSQQQVTDEIRFCSRCGFLLTGIAEVIENDGKLPGVSKKDRKKILTARKKGLKQGLFMLLLAILISPILMIFAKEMQIRPAMFILSMFILFVVGIVRMLYAKMFEADEPLDESFEQTDFQTAQNILSGKRDPAALPAAQTIPAADFVPPMQGAWRGSDELVFSNVTDVTTKQLDKK
jgi:hypothetical protein